MRYLAYAFICRALAVAGATMLVAFVMGGCGGGDGGPTGNASATGSVRDDGTLAPIVRATVRIQARSAVTDVNGEYTIASLPSGSMVLTASAGGYRDATVSVYMNPSTVNTIDDVHLIPVTTAGTGQITGLILDGTGNGVGQATIAVSGQVKAYTKSDGTFMAYSVDPGSHTIYIDHPQRGNGSASVTVTAGQTSDIGTVILGAEPPAPPVFPS